MIITQVSLPTNNDTVEYTYDAMGRRLTKKYTYHNGANTDVTTYKYHYIGGQITEIEIDSIRNPGESQTVLRNEEVKIHLGANSQPISYEWVKHVGESTTSATYYYHYDIHGNVLKVTDSSENVKITYTYDVLGKILTETNPDSILNFFTFRGASQTIWDSEVGMYYSGGYYRPDTGTALQGTGAPVLTNPASSAMLNAVAQATAANAQLAAHAMVSAATAGSANGGSPGGFSPPAGPSDGVSRAGRASPPPNPEPPPALVGYGGDEQHVLDASIVVYYDSEIGNYVVVPPPKRSATWEIRDPKTGEVTGYITDDNYFGEDTLHKQNIYGDYDGRETSYQYAEAVEVIDDQMPQNSGAGKVFEPTDGGESLPYNLAGTTGTPGGENKLMGFFPIYNNYIDDREGGSGFTGATLKDLADDYLNGVEKNVIDALKKKAILNYDKIGKQIVEAIEVLTNCVANIILNSNIALVLLTPQIRLLSLLIYNTLGIIIKENLKLLGNDIVSAASTVADIFSKYLKLRGILWVIRNIGKIIREISDIIKNRT